MKSIKKSFLLFSSVFCLSLPTFAYVDTTSGMRGTVNVSGATVVAEHTPTGITKTTTTGASGSFSLSFLPLVWRGYTRGPMSRVGQRYT